MLHFENLWGCVRGAFTQERVWESARVLALSSLVNLGRQTITGMISVSGQQFSDWSAKYRIFENNRVDTNVMFEEILNQISEMNHPESPLVAMIDDSQLRKKGRKVYGTAWRRDAQGPHFQTNFIWSQRILQISVAVAPNELPSPARSVPVRFVHCPTPVKPRKNASEATWKEYNRQKEEMKLSLKAKQQIHLLRTQMDQKETSRDRSLVITMDGGYTNETVMKGKPDRTTLIGRIRKDAKLFSLPEQNEGRGRHRCYGIKLPTPDQIRQDVSIPWKQVTAWVAGKTHEFSIKSITPVRWQTAGGKDTLKLIIIRPLHYRLSQRSPFLYREPGYLICTDTDLPDERIIQYYIWRWQIELNFRDEKTVLGIDQPQVRTKESVENVTSFLVAVYSLLLLSIIKTFGDAHFVLPPPKWRENRPPQRITTSQAISLLRAQLWGQALGVSNLTGFKNQLSCETKAVKLIPSLPSAVLYAMK